MLRNLIASLLLLLAAASSVKAYEYQIDYEQWRLSFFPDPSRTYRLKLIDRVEKDSSWFEYTRTDRFSFKDNTFVMGWKQWEKIWAWQIETGFTPHAQVLPREKHRFDIFLPPVFWSGSMPWLGIQYRRPREASVLDGIAGISLPIGGGFYIGAEGIRSRFRFVGQSEHFWANARRFEASYALSAARVTGFQAKRKEYFETGSPLPGGFIAEENGGAVSWNAGGTVLTVSYSHESRSNNTSVNKYIASAGMAF